jgi:hypothetical protein
MIHHKYYNSYFKNYYILKCDKYIKITLYNMFFNEMKD